MNLDKMITIRRRAPSQDAAGQTRETWRTIDEVWASIRPISARKQQAASGPRAEVTHEIIMRHGPALRSADEIQYNGRTFEVIAPINVDERDRYINALSKENAGDPGI